MQTRELIKAARNEIQVDLLLKNARMIDVYAGVVKPADIAVYNGYIVGFGDYQAKETVDLNQSVVAPGLIDPHVHIESSMTCVAEFARAVLPVGTTTVVADPHEIANVMGKDGIAYMLASSENLPMDIFFTLSSCVPATHMETSGAVLSAHDLAGFWDHPRIVGLAEMMNYPGVLYGETDVLDKLDQARQHGKVLDGHAPFLSGKDLFAYCSAGITSDHECTTQDEAMEKLSAGMYIMIREGTGAKNLKDLFPIINARTCHRLMWCTDDRHPHDLLQKGHIDSIIRDAIAMGLDPVMAIQMATLVPAQYFRLKDLGAIAPGKKANLIVLPDLNAFDVSQVYHQGCLVACNKTIQADVVFPDPPLCEPAMNVTVTDSDFSIPAKGNRIRAIQLVKDQIITRQHQCDAKIVENRVVSDTEQDILKILVFERHQNTGRVGKGFVHGFGLRKGALASSVAHDSHNIVVVGTNTPDMQMAVKTVARLKGGMVACAGSRVLAELALPIAGLMSDKPLHDIQHKLDKLIEAARNMGSRLTDPFMTLSFLALPVIPELKITDLGLVDVNRFEFVSLFLS